MSTYEPLPVGLRIQKSEIDGQGLFTMIFLKHDHILGNSHVVVGNGEIIRTPLGGFINHSDTPNCVKIKKGDRYYLKTLRQITEGEELTVKYSFYKIQTESEKMQEELEPL